MASDQVSVGAHGTHDIKLSDVADSPSTVVGLVLKRNNAGRLSYVKDSLQSFAPQRRSGAITFSDLHPGLELIHSQNNWNGGALAPVYNPANPNTYASADGMDLRGAHVMATGMKRKPGASFAVRNGNFEDSSDTSPWIAGTGVTRTIESAAARTGDFGLRLVTDGSRTTGDTLLSHDISGDFGADTFQGVKVRIVGYLRCDSNILVGINDGVDTTTTVVSGGSYTEFSVTKTMDGSASQRRIEVKLQSNESSATTIDMDDITFVAVVEDEIDMRCRKLAFRRGTAWGIFGHTVAYYDADHDLWVPSLIHDDTRATDIAVYKDNVLVAFGDIGDDGTGNKSYRYLGLSGTWITSALSPPENRAHFFAVVGDTLWKSIFTDTTNDTHFEVSSSTDPTSSWTTAVEVGDKSYKITGLYSAFNSLQVGKEDGFYLFNRFDNAAAEQETFVNVTEEWRLSPSLENFAHGVEWRGFLWLTVRGRLWAFRPLEFVDFSNVFNAPRLDDYGGQVVAMAAAPDELFLLLDTPVADSEEGKAVRLASMRDVGGQLVPHVLSNAQISTIGALGAMGPFDEDDFPDAPGFVLMGLGLGASDDFLVGDGIFAGTTWILPLKTSIPFHDASPELETRTVRAEMSRMDWNLPTEEKAAISLDVFLDGSVLDAEHTLTVKFVWDDGDEVTLGTLNSSSGGNHRRLLFEDINDYEADGKGRSIQLIFESETDDSVPVQVWAYTLICTYQPSAVDVLEVHVQMGNHTARLHGAGPDPDSKADKVTALTTLRDRTLPIVLTEDIDEDNTAAVSNVHIMKDSLRRRPDLEEKDSASEVWSFRMVTV